MRRFILKDVFLSILIELFTELFIDLVSISVGYMDSGIQCKVYSLLMRWKDISRR